MKQSFLLFFFIIVAFCNCVFSQNLVSNSSFETVTAEPVLGCEITNATGWLNPSGSACPNNAAGTPDLFSTFSTGQAVLPNSFMGTTTAHNGDRIAGLVTYHQQLADYREYLMTQLTCPLVAGQTYTVSFWTTGGDPVQYIYHSNNIGVYFSTAALSQSGYNLIGGITPQLELTSVIANSTWTFYTFSFTPTQAFTYMTIGNFRDDANTQSPSFGSNRPYAYYFFDDISVIPSTTSYFLGNDTTYCGGFSRTLSTGDPNTVWSTGVTASQITVTAAGTYWASLSSGCTNGSDTIVISQTASALFNLGNDTTLCSGQTLQLDVTNPGATYHWQDNSTNATFNITSAGNYSVSVSTATGCTEVGSLNVSYDTQAPAVNLGPDLEICGNQPALLTTGIPNANYLWSDHSTDSSLSVFATGTYSVTVSTGCGSDSDAVNVEVHADECALLIPTAFSPNADGVNDIFRVISRCPVKRFDLHVYNRWGEPVFETTEADEGWDGVFRNRQQPLGVYVYYVDYFNYCEQKMTKVAGNVTLVR